jgi:uncharacterized protein
VAGLLAEPLGTIRNLQVSAPPLDLGPDLAQTRGVEGEVRLTRTNRGLLVHGRLSTAIRQVCSRCLRDLEWPVDIEIDEEALPTIDFASGLPVDAGAEPDAFRLTDRHGLALEDEVRDAIRLAEPIAPLCREDCPGLCVECGQELATGPHDHATTEVDPRLEVLRRFAADSDDG